MECYRYNQRMKNMKIWYGCNSTQLFHYCFHATNHVIFVVIFLQLHKFRVLAKSSIQSVWGKKLQMVIFVVKENIDTATQFANTVETGGNCKNLHKKRKESRIDCAQILDRFA